MKILLDTNLYFTYMRSPLILQRFSSLELGAAGILAITVAKFEYGAHKNRNAERKSHLLPLQIIEFNPIAANA